MYCYYSVIWVTGTENPTQAGKGVISLVSINPVHAHSEEYNFKKFKYRAIAEKKKKKNLLKFSTKKSLLALSNLGIMENISGCFSTPLVE